MQLDSGELATTILANHVGLLVATPVNALFDLTSLTNESAPSKSVLRA